MKALSTDKPIPDYNHYASSSSSEGVRLSQEEDLQALKTLTKDRGAKRQAHIDLDRIEAAEAR